MVIAGYWSGSSTLNNAPENTVAPTSDARLFNLSTIGSTIEAMSPQCCIMPAYAMTSKMMEMVSSISLMPPADSRVSMSWAPVFDSAPATMESMSTEGSMPW